MKEVYDSEVHKSDLLAKEMKEKNQSLISLNCFYFIIIMVLPYYGIPRQWVGNRSRWIIKLDYIHNVLILPDVYILLCNIYKYDVSMMLYDVNIMWMKGGK